MNPSDMTGDPGIPNRPSVFTENYPPSPRIPFDWNAVPGTSQVPYGDFGPHQAPGFNMQPQVEAHSPNFQFGGNEDVYGHTQTVQFPFPNPQHKKRFEMSMYSFKCKRKTDSSPPRPSKQLITEEKMSEHLSKLHISSETPTSDMESEHVKEQRLYVCEEMKKFQAQTDSIIPEPLLSSINRPCTALVLWKPPTSILTPSFFNRTVEEDESGNNNNNSTRDNNPTINFQINDMDIEDL